MLMESTSFSQFPMSFCFETCLKMPGLSLNVVLSSILDLGWSEMPIFNHSPSNIHTYSISGIFSMLIKTFHTFIDTLKLYQLYLTPHKWKWPDSFPPLICFLFNVYYSHIRHIHAIQCSNNRSTRLDFQCSQTKRMLISSTQTHTRIHEIIQNAHIPWTIRLAPIVRNSQFRSNWINRNDDRSQANNSFIDCRCKHSHIWNPQTHSQQKWVIFIESHNMY